MEKLVLDQYASSVDFVQRYVDRLLLSREIEANIFKASAGTVRVEPSGSMRYGCVTKGGDIDFSVIGYEGKYLMDDIDQFNGLLLSDGFWKSTGTVGRGKKARIDIIWDVEQQCVRRCCRIVVHVPRVDKDFNVFNVDFSFSRGTQIAVYFSKFAECSLFRVLCVVIKSFLIKKKIYGPAMGAPNGCIVAALVIAYLKEAKFEQAIVIDQKVSALETAPIPNTRPSVPFARNDDFYSKHLKSCLEFICKWDFTRRKVSLCKTGGVFENKVFGSKPEPQIIGYGQIPMCENSLVEPFKQAQLVLREFANALASNNEDQVKAILEQ